MTLEEKTKKIKTAIDDIRDINNVLDNFDKQQANSVEHKVRTNIDYALAIMANRAKHNMPVGNIPFANLNSKEKRKALRMYRDAISDTLKALEITPIEEN